MRIFSIKRQQRFEDEASLWKAFQQGDVQAFEVIYQTHISALLAYGKHLCRDHDKVSDVVQDVFVDIWTRRAILRGLNSIRYYLFRRIRNKLARLRQDSVLFIDDQHTPPPNVLLTQSIEFIITQQETNQHRISQLKQAINRLPDRQREAVILAFYHNLGNDEIADIMGINHQSVINHLNRALASLRGVVNKAFLLLLYFVE